MVGFIRIKTDVDNTSSQLNDYANNLNGPETRRHENLTGVICRRKFQVEPKSSGEMIE